MVFRVLPPPEEELHSNHRSQEELRQRGNNICGSGIAWGRFVKMMPLQPQRVTEYACSFAGDHLANMVQDLFDTFISLCERVQCREVNSQPLTGTGKLIVRMQLDVPDVPNQR